MASLSTFIGGSFPYTLSYAHYDPIAHSRDRDALKPVNPLIPVPVKATCGHTRNMGLADGQSFYEVTVVW
jgi:hypothetical protein